MLSAGYERASSDSMAALQHLDGRNFRQTIVAGADQVRHPREHINRINVFPVPDGETGTNMALSRSATASAARAVDGAALGQVSRPAARNAKLEGILSWREDSGMEICLKSLEYLRRGGRIGRQNHSSAGCWDFGPSSRTRTEKSCRWPTSAAVRRLTSKRWPC
jgi:hypothetical protein